MNSALARRFFALTLTLTATGRLALLSAPLFGSTFPLQGHDTKTGHLDSRIGPAKPERYRSITDAKDWKNPYLVICRDGVDVRAAGVSSGRMIVAVADLRGTLIDVPIGGWPYGRIVAVQTNGIRAADGSDAAPIGANLNATLAILKALRVTAERWPSA